MNLSPLDDRYRSKVENLLPIFSEFGLAKYRTIVEIKWLLFISEKGISPKLDPASVKKLTALDKSFTVDDFAKIKEIEAVTNHDVKAVEIFLQSYLPENHWSWIHFGCTSEDINNTSYGLMLKDGMREIQKSCGAIQQKLKEQALEWKGVAMLSRTHGQTATPTTLGKEIAIFYARLNSLLKNLENTDFTAKFSGATGNYAAHIAAFPDLDWPKLSKEFIEKSLGLTWSAFTAQIEPHDNQAKLLNGLGQVSTVYIDLCRDIWGYISLGYFGQKVIKGEVGSSTMPHKVNPIDFENAEGNCKLARGIARTLADELPISRWQRDLTDSTLQRNFGLVFGHLTLAAAALLKGLNKLELNAQTISEDLEKSPEVLTEAVQTVLRAHGHADAYDQLKTFSRGQKLSLEQVQEFINSTDLPEEDKQRLLKLTPQTYTGASEHLVDQYL